MRVIVASKTERTVHHYAKKTSFIVIKLIVLFFLEPRFRFFQEEMIETRNLFHFSLEICKHPCRNFGVAPVREPSQGQTWVSIREA